MKNLIFAVMIIVLSSCGKTEVRPRVYKHNIDSARDAAELRYIKTHQIGH